MGTSNNGRFTPATLPSQGDDAVCGRTAQCGGDTQYVKMHDAYDDLPDNIRFPLDFNDQRRFRFTLTSRPSRTIIRAVRLKSLRQVTASLARFARAPRRYCTACSVNFAPPCAEPRGYGSQVR